MENSVSKDNEWGQEILSNRQLGKRISRQSLAIGALAIVVLGSSISSFSGSRDRPLMLDTNSGVIITEYRTALEKLTAEERALIAVSTYEGLRRRTGIASVDGAAVGKWLGNITPNGVNAWHGLGKRWEKINFVQPGFSRTIQVNSVKPNNDAPYAFTVYAIESEAEVGKPLSAKSYRVRFTMYFSDPEIEGVSRLDGIDLHEEELVK